MKSKLHLAMTAVAMSLIIIFASNFQGVASSPTADVYLGRIIYEPPKSTQIYTTDANSIGKYPGMQAAIEMADKQYENYQRICSKYPCNTTSTVPGDIGPVPHFQLSADLAKEMINDPSYGFRYSPPPDRSAELYPTYIKYENNTYGILISIK